MAIIKDPYELTIWGTKQEALAQAEAEGTSSGTIYNKINKFGTSLFQDIIINIKENRLASNVAYRLEGAKSLEIYADSTKQDKLLDVDLKKEVFRGTYEPRTRILIETHKKFTIKWGDMYKSASLNKLLPNGSLYEWRFISSYDLKKELATSNITSSNCRAVIGNANLKLSTDNSNISADGNFYFAPSVTGQLRVCAKKTTDANSNVEVVYPLKNPIVTTFDEYVSLLGDTQKQNYYYILGKNSSGRVHVLNSAIADTAKTEEYRIATIGSDQLNSKFRAVEPKFVENINGTHTLTFKMYYNINGEENPLINYMVNERVVKLHWKGQWYDMVVKNSVKDSNDKSLMVTCTDVSINELSKIGFNIELNADLYNNQGTNIELAKAVVKDNTDWIVDEVQSDLVRQKQEEPVYEAVTKKKISNLTNETIGAKGQSIAADSKILIYANQILNYIETDGDVNIGYFQFAALSEDETVFKTDGISQLVYNVDCYSKNSFKLKLDATNHTFVVYDGAEAVTDEINYWTQLSNNYRAERLVRQRKTIFDPLVDKYVDILKATNASSSGLYKAGDEIYHYQQSNFIEPTVINNLFVNSSGFVGVSGWTGYLGKDDKTTSDGVADYRIVEEEDGYTSYLILPAGARARNRGLSNMATFIPDGFSKGDLYCFRYKAYWFKGKKKVKQSKITSGIHLHIGAISDADKNKNENSYITDATGLSGMSVYGNDGWVYSIYKFTKPLPYSDFSSSNNITLNIYQDAEEEKDVEEEKKKYVYIQDIQFFKCAKGMKAILDDAGNITDKKEQYMVPGDMDYLSINTIEDKYYNHTKLLDATGALKKDITQGDIQYLGASSDFEPQYNDNFVKIRSIEASKSNIFNILQSIGETFGCWTRFVIEHDSAGAAVRKKIVFKEVVGEETGIGFEYGTDLKSISRTIQSDQFVTKVIVPPNANKYGKDGFCAIGRSDLSISRANYILNFDYYVLHKMLSLNSISRDLYDKSQIGLYPKLREYNLNYDQLSALKTQYLKDLDTQNAVYEANAKGYDAAKEEIDEAVHELEVYLGIGDWWNDDERKPAMIGHSDKKTGEITDVEVKTRLERLSNARSVRNKFSEGKRTASANRRALKSQIKNTEADLKQQINNINRIEKKFFDKYSHFIREGTWNSEEYSNDDLYYLDAQKVAFTSAHPQVSYSISVLRLSALEDFRTKVFNVGDIAYVEDVEFFGYIVDDDRITNKTPYHEKVLISEITSFLDEPDKDVITVQNYRSNFEDLMQKVVAVTQSLQFSQGQYARTASLVDTNGAITAQALQLALNTNPQVPQVSSGYMMIRTEEGVKVIAPGDSSRQSMLTADGLFITTNGGETWTKITGSDGTNTSTLKNGVIYPRKIMIMDGEYPRFRWDSKGISAFDMIEGSGNDNSVNFSKFVRFDRFGVYGVISNYIEIDNNGSTGDRTDVEPDLYYIKKNGQYIPLEFQPSDDGFSKYYMISKYSFNNEEEVWNSENVPFYLGWKGFKLQAVGKKNGETTGSVEISNTDDIRVLKKTWVQGASTLIEKIRIGRIYEKDGNGQDIPDKYDYGIRIQNDNGESVFETDEDGNLTVTGTINATNGEFSGHINATSGTIGGFNIGADKLESTKLIEDEEGNPLENKPVLTINGTKGEIILGDPDNAYGNIQIKGSKDESYIRGPNFSITPTEATFLNVNVSGSLTSSVLKVNDIQGVGGSMIFKPAYKVSDISYIQPNRYEFTLDMDDADQSGDDNNPALITYIQTGDYCLTSIVSSSSRETEGETIVLNGYSSTYAVVKVVSVYKSTNKIRVECLTHAEQIDDVCNSENSFIANIIDLGKNNPCVIGVHSEKYPGAEGLLKGEGLTISTIKTNDAETKGGIKDKDGNDIAPGLKANLNLFLGNLDDIADEVGTAFKNLGGWGLYSDNVFLKGALVTTNFGPFGYAGVNTREHINAPDYEDAPWHNSNPGEIVIWGGAKSDDEADIMASKFFVTDNGNLYANSGYFRGSIITDSVLRAAEIETAVIRGMNYEADSEQFYGLKIIGNDGSNNISKNIGIGFFQSNTSSVPIFAIGNKGLRTGRNLIGFDETEPNKDYFIDINNNKVNFYGYKASLYDDVSLLQNVAHHTSMANDGYLSFMHNGIGFYGEEDNELKGMIRMFDKGAYIGGIGSDGTWTGGLQVQNDIVRLLNVPLVFGDVVTSPGEFTPKENRTVYVQAVKGGIDIKVY